MIDFGFWDMFHAQIMSHLVRQRQAQINCSFELIDVYLLPIENALFKLLCITILTLIPYSTVPL